MNSIDAVIAICAICGCFALMLGAVKEQKNNAQSTFDSMKAKTNAQECGAIIDSIYSNSAERYTGLVKCESEGTFVSASSGGKTKTFQTIGESKKTQFLEVETLNHYK